MWEIMVNVLGRAQVLELFYLSVGAAFAFFKMVGQLLGAASQGSHIPNDTGKPCRGKVHHPD